MISTKLAPPVRLINARIMAPFRSARGGLASFVWESGEAVSTAAGVFLGGVGLAAAFLAGAALVPDLAFFGVTSAFCCAARLFLGSLGCWRPVSGEPSVRMFVIFIWCPSAVV